MTPDEVVKELEIHYQTNCMVGDIGVAIKSAISFLQDYQKLRERMENIKSEKYNKYFCVIDKNILQAMVTYLQQPTESIAR
jgi:hypothetical protein